MSKSLALFPFKIYPRLEAWGVRIAALLTAIMGTVNLTSAVTPALSSRMVLIESFLPLEVRHGSRVTSALAGFALYESSRYARNHMTSHTSDKENNNANAA